MVTTTFTSRSSGQQLRGLREQLGFTLREVEHAAERIAQKLGHPDFNVPVSRLSDIETKSVCPSIYKLYSLSLIYRSDLRTLMRWFGVDTGRSHLEFSLPTPPNTGIATEMAYSPTAVVPELDPGFSFEKTLNIGRFIQRWGAVPFTLLQTFLDRRYTYGYVGTSDWMMYPLIPPGSFLQIDEDQTRVESMGWKSEYDRPVYFVETREGYFCCWCSLLRPNQIILQPHTLSWFKPVILRLSEDVDIIGKVIAVAKPLVVQPPPEAPVSNRE